MAGLEPGTAGQASAVFPVVGAVSVLCCGLLSDRLRGRYGRVLGPSVLLLAGALAALILVPTAGRPILTLSLIGVVSFFLMAPYTLAAAGCWR